MDAIKAAGWTRFKPVKGQPIAEADIKEVFKMVDMDKSGAISQLVIPILYCNNLAGKDYFTHSIF